MTPVSRSRRALLAALLAALPAALACVDAHGDDGMSTVCTITVNSADEKEIFRRSLPEDRFRIVELVERGRPDWLAAACRQQVRCDELVISGHFDGGKEFYSDRLDAREFLPVDELERASCSASCDGLFSQLKEVYLFGCNTLDADPDRSAPEEVVRNLMAAGRSRAEAEHLAQVLSERHGESSRDVMRRIFANVPTIYGFSSVAPLGPTAAAILEQYFQSAGSSEVGSGHASRELLGYFSANSMTVAGGIGSTGPEAAHRDDVCRFYDERLSPAQKLDYVHALMDRGMPEARMFFDRIEQFAGSVGEADRATPSYAAAQSAIAQDKTAREGYLKLARDAEQASVRLRMLEVARKLGWLTASEQRVEQRRMIDGLLARKTVSPADVGLVCALNDNRALDAELAQLAMPRPAMNDAGHAALLACLGSTEGHARVLRALTSTSDDEVQIAQVYFAHRPIVDVQELREVAAGIGRMHGSESKVRALDTLAHHYLSDRESLDSLARLYPRAESADVQRAIAGNFIRADYAAITKGDLVRMLRQYRIKSGDGADLIDALIRRLEAP